MLQKIISGGGLLLLTGTIIAWTAAPGRAANPIGGVPFGGFNGGYRGGYQPGYAGGPSPYFSHPDYGYRNDSQPSYEGPRAYQYFPQYSNYRSNYGPTEWPGAIHSDMLYGGYGPAYSDGLIYNNPGLSTDQVPYLPSASFPTGSTYNNPGLGTGQAPYLPSASLTATAAAPADPTAHVVVSVPANARLWFNGTETTTTGSVREFQSPALGPGYRYAYEVRAQWQQNGRTVTQTRKVAVSPGARTELAFPLPSGTEG